MDHTPLGSSVHGILQQEYWSGLPFPTPGDFPDPGIEPASLPSPALVDGFFTTSSPGQPTIHYWCLLFSPPLSHPPQGCLHIHHHLPAISPVPHGQLPLWQLQLSKTLMGAGSTFFSVREQESFCHFCHFCGTLLSHADSVLLSRFLLSRRNKGNKGNLVTLTLRSHFCHFCYFCGT